MHRPTMTSNWLLRLTVQLNKQLLLQKGKLFLLVLFVQLALSLSHLTSSLCLPSPLFSFHPSSYCLYSLFTPLSPSPLSTLPFSTLPFLHSRLARHLRDKHGDSWKAKLPPLPETDAVMAALRNASISTQPASKEGMYDRSKESGNAHTKKV